MKRPYPLYWAGSSLEFIFTGETLHLTFDAGFTRLEPWISAELNGAPLLRMPLERGASRVCLFRGMTPGVPRHIRIFKETQPITDDPRHRLEVVEVTGTGGEILVDLEGFEEGALAFLRQLRAEHPAAKLVWACGMLGDPLRPQLERAVRRFGSAWYLPLPVVTAETMGSRQHPGPLCHRAAAQTTAEYLKTILLWKG